MPTTTCARTTAASPPASRPRCKASSRAFSPDAFDQRLEEGALDRFLPGNRKARQWDLLLELYEDIAKEAQDDFWSVFEREFRRAYATATTVDRPDDQADAYEYWPPKRLRA